MQRNDEVQRDDKERARAGLLAQRRMAGSRTAAGRTTTGRLLALPELAAARSVAAYASIGTEPATADVLEGLTRRRVRVLLPVLRADRDLDWAEYTGPAALAAAGSALREPVGARLGVGAVAGVDVVVVPALAVDADTGVRLGRGGGSYDRALARVPVDVPVVALLYDGEVRPGVPAQPHDQPVDVAVTPSRVHRFAGRRWSGSPGR